MTASRWLALLVALGPTLPPFLYGTYLWLADREGMGLQYLPWHEAVSMHFASFVWTTVACLTIVGLIAGWGALIVHLWGAS